MSMSPIISKCCDREAKYRNVAGMDGLKYEVEHHRVQQREGHQGSSKQPLEAGHPHVQQVVMADKSLSEVLNTCLSASEAFDSTYPTNVVVTSEGTCTYIPPGEESSNTRHEQSDMLQASLCRAVRWTSLGFRLMIRIAR